MEELMSGVMGRKDGARGQIYRAPWVGRVRTYVRGSYDGQSEFE